MGEPFLRANNDILDFARKCAYMGNQTRKTINKDILQQFKSNLNLNPQILDLIEEYVDLFNHGLKQPTTSTTQHKKLF